METPEIMYSGIRTVSMNLVVQEGILRRLVKRPDGSRRSDIDRH